MEQITPRRERPLQSTNQRGAPEGRRLLPGIGRQASQGCGLLYVAVLSRGGGRRGGHRHQPPPWPSVHPPSFQRCCLLRNHLLRSGLRCLMWKKKMIQLKILQLSLPSVCRFTALLNSISHEEEVRFLNINFTEQSARNSLKHKTGGSWVLLSIRRRNQKVKPRMPAVA